MTKKALVIGGGPAGLMAAEQLIKAGLSVTIAEAKPTLGRKFLMAGKSGLNLTMDEPVSAFLPHYYDARTHLDPMIASFGPQEVKEWTEKLGQKIFVGTSGRVFPKVMKASPLLRAWITRLLDAGVSLTTNWKLSGLSENNAQFLTPDGAKNIIADVVVLAMGGASWARLGSDGAWVEQFGPITPFQPANCAFAMDWSNHMTKFFGTPIKNITLRAGDMISRGEIIVSRNGIEGGGIYSVSRTLRTGVPLAIDLRPDWTVDRVETALSKPRGKDSQTNHLRKALKLDPIKIALMREVTPQLPQDAKALAKMVKCLSIKTLEHRPMDEAISTAGGIPWNRLDAGLMLMDRPGIFCAGEMIDWEAPTGGYLITACLATGRWAGLHAAQYAQRT
ncbi:MAG: TIGR03862 family flavoprotein [Paracoccaceae bacterium]